MCGFVVSVAGTASGCVYRSQCAGLLAAGLLAGQPVCSWLCIHVSLFIIIVCVCVCVCVCVYVEGGGHLVSLWSSL